MHGAIPLSLAALIAARIIVKDTSLSLGSAHTIVPTFKMKLLADKRERRLRRLAATN